MECIIKQQNEIGSDKWNNFVYANSMGWAYFLYELIGIDRWASYQNYSFAIVDKENNDEILFIMQLHKTNKHPFLSKIRIKQETLHSRWGYVLKDNLPKKQFRKVKECFENYIDGLISKNNIKKLDIALPPLTEANINNKSSVNPLMVFNFKPDVRYSYAVDLSKPDDRILADCEETTRQAIRKNEASGKYEIIEAKSAKEDFEIYVKLHKETYTRTNAKSSIIANPYHENMFFNLLPKGICKIYFLKEKESQEVIATAAILIYKNTAYYWWGDSKNEKEVGINKYLLYKCICFTREAFGKTGFFETGGAYVYLRNGKYKGLNDFKKCFGTFLVPIWCGTYSKVYKKWFLTAKRIIKNNPVLSKLF